MFKMPLIALSLCTLTQAAIAAQTVASGQADVAATIIALERAALDRSDKGDVEGFLELCDPDVTYFDPTLDKPIHGLPALAAYYHGFPAFPPSRGEMSNVKVQVSGEVAVLTFNYDYASRAAGLVKHWNTTEVYAYGANGWHILHTHWSYIKPPAPNAR
jgi:ketosteroid isomerase-like protein